MRYTNTQSFSFNKIRETRSIIVQGEVQINVWDTLNWIPSEVITTGSAEIYTAGVRLQIVPTESSSYLIDERD